MFDLGCDFSFHRILRTCALATAKCPDKKLIDTIVVSAFDVVGNPSPSPSSRLAMVSGLGAIVARIHENGVLPHPAFLALADVLTRKIDENSFVAALYVIAPDKLPSHRIAFSEESVMYLAKHIVDHADVIMAKPPTDPAEISRLVCAIEKGPI